MDESSTTALDRRRFLGALSAAVGSGLAGCPAAGRTETTRGADLTPAPVPTTEQGEPVPAGLAGLPCPRFPGSAVTGTRTCGTTPEDPLAMVAYDRRARLPSGTLRFQFRNTSPDPLSGLSPPWSLQKFVGGEWHVVRPLRIRSGTASAATGATDRRTWRLAIDNAATRRLDPRRTLVGGTDGDLTRVPLAGLGGGRYAFVVAGWLGEVGRDSPTAVGARFRLDGSALELTPTADVERTDPGGPAVVLDADPGRGEAVTYVLKRAPDWDDVPRLLAEEAVLNPPLRDLLAAYTPSTTRVTLRTRRHPAYPALSERLFSFRGDVFWVEPDPDGE